MTSKQKDVWILVVLIAIFQVLISLVAAYSSSKDNLSDVACQGGLYGTLVNLLVLCAVLIWSLVLAIKFLKEKAWSSYFKPLVFLLITSATAIFLGGYAALRCTV